MDVLKQQLTRLQQQLAALSASQKMLSVSLVAIMVMTLIWWARYAGAPEMEPLLNQSLTADDLVRMRARLDGARIDYRVSGDRILVGADRQYEALALLASEQLLPRDTSNGFNDIIAKMNPFQSQQMNQELWNVGKQTALEQIIRTMPGVAAAKVMLTPTSERRIGGNIEPTASVAITMRSGSVRSRKLAEATADLVVGSVAGLKRNRVSVIMDGVTVPVADREGNPLAVSGDVSEHQAAAEHYFQEKVERALGYFQGGVIVSVFVKVDIEAKRTQEKSFPRVDQKETSLKSETTESTPGSPGGGGEPGAAANMAMALQGTGSGGTGATATTEKTETTFQNYAHEKLENTDKPAGTATPVSAMVRVPRGYFVNALKLRDPSGKEPDEKAVQDFVAAQMQEIRNDVKHILNLQSDSDVTVNTYVDSLPMVASAAAAAPPSGITASVTSHAKEIAVGALAMISLFMVTMMVRKGTPSAPAAAPIAPQQAREPELLTVGEELLGEAVEGNGMLDGMELDDDALKSQQMVEQVSTMVKENPEGAATLVKRWLNRT